MTMAAKDTSGTISYTTIDNNSGVFQKLLLPLRDEVRVDLVTLGQFNDRLFSLQGIQGYLCLECRRVVPSWSFCHLRLLLSLSL